MQAAVVLKIIEGLKREAEAERREAAHSRIAELHASGLPGPEKNELAAGKGLSALPGSEEAR